MTSTPIALLFLLALAACAAAPPPVATLPAPQPSAVGPADEQIAALPSAPIVGPALVARGDLALPPALPSWKRVSLTPVEALPSIDRIVVHKTDRRLELVQDGAVVRSYQVGLGWQTVGHKVQSGDGRTPEGVYWIDGRNPRSAFHRSLKISYPSPDDRAAARERGFPPGGMIMIHGQPNDPRSFARAQRERDWTEGCIAVTNAEIEEIWAMVADGTTIEIKP
ncbi:MAG: murein L,D-transpeptidase family protein [Alphaproteobacteria bacterium]